jgi:hypothetical protein
MDKETIQQIAAQVVAQLPLGLLMIVKVVIGVLVSALTALGVSYFRTRGQNLATKHDFDELEEATQDQHRTGCEYQVRGQSTRLGAARVDDPSPDQA